MRPRWARFWRAEQMRSSAALFAPTTDSVSGHTITNSRSRASLSDSDGGSGADRGARADQLPAGGGDGGRGGEGGAGAVGGGHCRHRGGAGGGQGGGRRGGGGGGQAGRRGG